MIFDPGEYRMAFGKYEGKSLDEIASTKEGLRWLDWAAEAFDPTSSAGAAINMYVTDPQVQREIEEALERRW